MNFTCFNGSFLKNSNGIEQETWTETSVFISLFFLGGGGCVFLTVYKNIKMNFWPKVILLCKNLNCASPSNVRIVKCRHHGDSSISAIFDHMWSVIQATSCVCIYSVNIPEQKHDIATFPFMDLIRYWERSNLTKQNSWGE